MVIEAGKKWGKGLSLKLMRILLYFSKGFPSTWSPLIWRQFTAGAVWRECIHTGSSHPHPHHYHHHDHHYQSHYSLFWKKSEFTGVTLTIIIGLKTFIAYRHGVKDMYQFKTITIFDHQKQNCTWERDWNPIFWQLLVTFSNPKSLMSYPQSYLIELNFFSIRKLLSFFIKKNKLAHVIADVMGKES